MADDASTRRDVASLRARLQRDFAGRLPARLARLRAVVEDGASSAAAREAAHQLKGTAASYGFAELAGRVARLEELLRARPIDRGAIDAALREAAAAAERDSR